MKIIGNAKQYCPKKRRRTYTSGSGWSNLVSHHLNSDHVRRGIVIVTQEASPEQALIRKLVDLLMGRPRTIND